MSERNKEYFESAAAQKLEKSELEKLSTYPSAVDNLDFFRRLDWLIWQNDGEGEVVSQLFRKLETEREERLGIHRTVSNAEPVSEETPRGLELRRQQVDDRYGSRPIKLPE